MMKASKVYVFRVTVEGRGTFPIDMLRYDRCVPRTGDDVHAIVMASIAERPLETRKVSLQMYSTSKEGPTKDRWKSFGWEVIAIEETTFR